VGAPVENLQLGRYKVLAYNQGAPSWAVVFPGVGYSTEAPLLWYARRAAFDAGRNVLLVTDVLDRHRDDPVAWVEERCRAVLNHLRSQDAHPLLITKSTTSLAARIAATEGLPAVWLTPLIAGQGSTVAAQVLAGLRAGTEPRLLIGGSHDPNWDGAVASTLPNAEALELPGADHALEVPDVAKSLDHLRRVWEAMTRFAAGSNGVGPR
jgi:hypothetical protein